MKVSWPAGVSWNAASSAPLDASYTNALPVGPPLTKRRSARLSYLRPMAACPSRAGTASCRAPVFVSISSTLPVGIDPTYTLLAFPAAMPSGLNPSGSGIFSGPLAAIATAATAEVATSRAAKTARSLLMPRAYPEPRRAKHPAGNLALTSQGGADGGDHPLPVRDDLAPEPLQRAHGRGSGRQHDRHRHRGQPSPHRDVEPASRGPHGVQAAARGGGGAREGARRTVLLGLLAAGRRCREARARGRGAERRTPPGRRRPRRPPARAGARPRQPVAVEHRLRPLLRGGLSRRARREEGAALPEGGVHGPAGGRGAAHATRRAARRARGLPRRRARAHRRRDGRLPADGRGRVQPGPGRLTLPAQHAPQNAMTDPGEIERFHDRCSDLMRELLGALADAPDRPRTFPQIEDALGWPHRRIASVLGGVSRMRHTEFAGRRPYRFRS